MLGKVPLPRRPKEWVAEPRIQVLSGSKGRRGWERGCGGGGGEELRPGHKDCRGGLPRLAPFHTRRTRIRHGSTCSRECPTLRLSLSGGSKGVSEPPTAPAPANCSFLLCCWPALRNWLLQNVELGVRLLPLLPPICSPGAEVACPTFEGEVCAARCNRTPESRVTVCPWASYFFSWVPSSFRIGAAPGALKIGW